MGGLTVTEEHVSQAGEHYKDWPNTIGFESEFEQHAPAELRITGEIPAYTAGILYRTGPGNYKLTAKNGKQIAMSHWFDGFTTVHRFSILAEQKDEAGKTKVRVFYNSKRTVDAMLKNIRKTGQLKDFSFGQKRDPCQSFFNKLMTVFTPNKASDHPSGSNIGVTISPNLPGFHAPTNAASSHSSGVKTLVSKSDHSMLQQLDPETLEPIGLCQQSVLHPDLKGQLSASHAKTCPVTGDLFNYNLDVSQAGTYRVFQVSAATGKTSVLARFGSRAAYLHSLFLTPRTVVVCVWNSHYSARGMSLLWNRNIIDSIAPLDPSLPAKWYVIDRSPARRGVIGVFDTPAFFCFHTINAYEEPSKDDPEKTDIVADLVAYQDLTILHRFYYENLISNGSQVHEFHKKADSFQPFYSRYRLPGITLPPSLFPSSSLPSTTTEYKNTSNSPPAFNPSSITPAQGLLEAKVLLGELPGVNPRLHTRKHRYVYSVLDTGRSSFFDGLGKFDCRTRETRAWWRKEGHTPGEPIFVPDPAADPVNNAEADEDRGTLLSVVLDGPNERSYLLALDARTMEELGTAQVDGVVGFGFHGNMYQDGGEGGLENGND